MFLRFRRDRFGLLPRCGGALTKLLDLTCEALLNGGQPPRTARGDRQIDLAQFHLQADCAVDGVVACTVEQRVTAGFLGGLQCVLFLGFLIQKF